MKRLSFSPSQTAFALFASVALTGAARAQTPAGAELLRVMAKAEQSASYSGIEVVTQSGAPTLKTRVWRQGLKRRVEFLEPPVRRGDVLVDNGTDVWLYHSRERAAVQTKSLRRVADVAGLNKTNNMAARVTGPATVAGRRAWVVELGGKGNKATRRIWVDAATKVRLRIDRFAAGGTLAESSALQSVQFGPVPAARFAFTPPSGTKVTRTSGKLFMQLAPAKKAAGWLQYPRTVPPGYVFESAIVDNKKDEAWLRYTNGVQRFSIFQQRADDPKTLSAATQPRSVNGGWYWQGGGSRMLGVDIPRSLADQVIRSVR